MQLAGGPYPTIAESQTCQSCFTFRSLFIVDLVVTSRVFVTLKQFGDLMKSSNIPAQPCLTRFCWYAKAICLGGPSKRELAAKGSRQAQQADGKFDSAGNLNARI